jgi:predicted alpha/beta-fold hydrolase
MGFRDVRAELSGHGWTIGAYLLHTVRPARPPLSEPWSVVAEDPKVGPVRITGRLRHEPSTSLVVIVHGLGGDVDAPYMTAGAIAASAAGFSSLRVNLRGADRSGEDFYHAGLTADLHAAVGSEKLARYERIFVLGYSLGGHVSLRYATDQPDPRVVAVAAVSPPLDLDLSAHSFDRSERAIYRRNVLGGLKEIYASVARRRPVPTPWAEVRKIQKMREWDDRVVAPRYGFRDAEHYYDSVSVGPRLPTIDLRSLVVFARNDPMVPADVVRASAEACGPKTLVKWVERGGHMAFPSDLDLACGGPLGLEGQIMHWFLTGVSSTGEPREAPWAKS